MEYRAGLRKINGFTLMEMVVSIAIISTISSIFLANYHSTNKRSDLIMTTQQTVANIRLMQNNSLSLTDFNGIPPKGGWGVYFTMASSSSYFLFADVDGDHQYQDSELSRIVTLPAGITVSNIEGIGGNTSIVFLPPSPETYITGTAHPVSADNRHNETFITMREGNGSTKKVFINYFGLISTE